MAKKKNTNCRVLHPLTGLELTLEEQLKAGFSVNKTPVNAGIYQGMPPCNGPTFKGATGEKIYDHGNAYIVFGHDRPSTKKSGFGALGSDRASMIDIVVGRMAGAFEGDGVPSEFYVDNSMSADAARVYISQLTNIDKVFSLTQGSRPSARARSGIGIKADAVRIIGRDNVKIVTSRARGVRGFGLLGETNSLGGRLATAGTIELIAGNATDNEGLLSKLRVMKKLKGEKDRFLQPAVKGDNVVKCIKHLKGLVRDLNQYVKTIQSNQNRINQWLGLGVQFASIAYGAGSGLANFCVEYSDQYNSWMRRRTSRPLHANAAALTVFDTQYLIPIAPFYVCSDSVWLS